MIVNHKKHKRHKRHKKNFISGCRLFLFFVPLVSLACASCGSCWLNVERFTKSTNLCGVIVCVVRIDREPVLSCVTAAFSVCADALPVFFRHHSQQWNSGFARRAKRCERRRLVTIVIVKPRGELVLIVTFDDGVIFDEQLSYAERGG